MGWANHMFRSTGGSECAVEYGEIVELPSSLVGCVVKVPL